MRLWTLSLLTLSCALAAVTACSDTPKEDDAKSEESNATNADDLYVKTDVMQVTIAAPLQQLFDRYKAGKADPPPEAGEGGNGGFAEREFSEPGKLTFKLGNEEKSLDMRVYTRGESSKGDCPFMKLKVDFTDKEQLKKTFSGNKDFGGTHNIDSFGVKADKSKGFQIPQDFDLGAITQADIQKYRIGPYTDAQKGLANAAVAKLVAEHKDEVYKAYAQAEKECIAANAIKSTDGKTTTDPGFLEAKKRIDGIFALPEIQTALGGGGGGAEDAGGDAK